MVRYQFFHCDTYNIMNKAFTLIQSYWVPITALILCAITALSLSPLPQLPGIPGTDKTHHLIAYAALMFPVALRKTKYWFLIALAFVTYSGLIELIQPYVNRYGEWLDLLANTAGIVIGVVLGFVANKLLLTKKV